VTTAGASLPITTTCLSAPSATQATISLCASLRLPCTSASSHPESLRCATSVAQPPLPTVPISYPSRLTPPHLTSSHLTPPHPTSSHLIPSHLRCCRPRLAKWLTVGYSSCTATCTTQTPSCSRVPTTHASTRITAPTRACCRRPHAIPYHTNHAIPYHVIPYYAIACHAIPYRPTHRIASHPVCPSAFPAAAGSAPHSARRLLRLFDAR
jgi:hypothetical protein